MDSITQAVLGAIRLIIRSSDLHSSDIRRNSGLSSPQVLLLKAVVDFPEATTGQLAHKISLSHATTTTVLNRLESLGFISRYRSQADRRRVHVNLTAPGRDAMDAAPSPMQQHFVDRFEGLLPHERTSILSALQHVADMMKLPGIGEPDGDTAEQRHES